MDEKTIDNNDDDNEDFFDFDDDDNNWRRPTAKKEKETISKSPFLYLNVSRFLCVRCALFRESAPFPLLLFPT